MSALLLAFAISLPGAVSFEDLSAADQRCLLPGNNTAWFNQWCERSGEMSISHSFLKFCQVACITLGIPAVALFFMVGGAALTPSYIDDGTPASNRVKQIYFGTCLVILLSVVAGIILMFFAVHIHWMIIGPPTSSLLAGLNEIYAAMIGLVPVGFMVRLRLKRKGGQVGAGGATPGVSPEGGGGRSIAALVDAACADAGEGIAASQKAFAVKMIEGLGYAGEAGFVQEAPKLDWGRHMPGFPCRVELCLKNYLDLA